MVDWSGIIFCGITFDWQYNNGFVDVSMPGYVQKVLQKFQHKPPKSPQFSPFSAAPYVKAIKGQHQYAPKIDSSSLPFFQNYKGEKFVSILLYYARDFDNILLPALNKIAEKQYADTKRTEDQCHGLFDYVATQSNISLRLYPTNQT